jgi:glycosyltransferase involved in cell wall biosynthesis
MSFSLIGAEPQDFRIRVVVPLPPPAVDVVTVVRNQESNLARRVTRLSEFLRDELPFSARITVADRASSDATSLIAMQLAAELPNVRVLQINEQGRGRALAAAWLTSDARVLACIDLDASADLAPLPLLLAPVVAGHSAISIGAYVRAIRADIARRLIPGVLNRGWFFESELLVRARLAGLRIDQQPA